MKRLFYFVAGVVTSVAIFFNAPILAVCAEENTVTESGEVDENEALYENVYNILIAQEAVLPEGTPLTNDSFYYAWHGGYFPIGYGCVAFAFYLSDLAFGTSPARIHRDYNDIKVGDILRINNNTHSVIVLEVNDDSVIVAEGNYNSKVHWGRKLSKSDIIDENSYIMTRY
jgi:hypothetical protein